MTTINLKPETVSTFLTCRCATYAVGICSIVCREISSSKVLVQAEIPSTSAPNVLRVIQVEVENDGSTIHSACCTCNGGKFKCKHICKVLHRIVDSQRNLLPVVIDQGLQREAEPKRLLANLQQEMVQQVVPNVRERKRKTAKVAPPTGSVYIAMTCWKGKHSGVENADTEILGVFSSKQLANECAQEAAHENKYGFDDDEEEEVNSWFDANGLFSCYKYQPDMAEENNLDSEKFWVERFVIDASPDLHT